MKRRSQFDALRIAACCMVVMIHVSFSKWDAAPVRSLHFIVCNLFDSMVSPAAVPLFVMLSGALFLGREELPPVRVLLKKYVLRLVVLYLLAALLYALDEVGVGALAAPEGWKRLAAATVRGKYHLWYLPRLAGTYALLPLLWCAVRYENGKYVRYLLAACFFFVTVKTTLRMLPIPQAAADFIEQFEFPLNSFAPYALLGWYLSDRPKHSRTLLLLVWALAVAAAAAANYLDSLRSDTPQFALLGSGTIFAYVQAAALFELFRTLPDAPEGRARRLAAVSRDTLGIYILHVFVLEHLERWFGFSVLSLPIYCAIPLLTASVLLICLPLSAALRRISGNKLL